MAKTRTQVKETKKANVDERKWKAFEMRKDGHSYRTIGAALGVSYQTIRKDIKDALKTLHEETMDVALDYRNIQVNRMEDILAVHRPIAKDATNPEHARAADVVLKYEALIAKLMGTEELPLQRIETSQSDGNVFTIEYIGISPDDNKEDTPDVDAS